MAASFNFDDDIRRAKKERSDRLEQERIASEKRIQSSKEQCEKDFNVAKDEWFERKANEIRQAIVEQVSTGKSEWVIEIGKPLSILEIQKKSGRPSELQEKSISVKDIYEELVAELSEYYDASIVQTKPELVTNRCKGFVSTGGVTGMTCKCGSSRSQHKERPAQIASISIVEKNCTNVIDAKPLKR